VKINSSRIHRCGALFGALAILSGCGGASPSLTTTAGNTTHDSATASAMPSSLPPLALELQVLTARGQLQARGEGGDWKLLSAGASLAGVRELRAVRRGAVVALGHGDAAGRLWLRAGTTVRLGQDERGVHVAVISGRARLRRSAAALPLLVEGTGRSRAIEGDYLLESGLGGLAQLTPTGARLDQAAWSLGLDRPVGGQEEGSGIGRLEAETATTALEPLALRKVVVDIQTAGDLAITSVEHVFHNPAELDREGTFRFPVPDGALLTGLAMEIHGKLVEGEIVEREKAREIYEKIVDDMQDPALLEWEQGNWFKLRVFPIEAKSDKRVIIRYAAPLSRGASGWEATFSLDAPQLQSAPIGELLVRVNGQIVDRETQVTAGVDLAIPVGDAAVPAVTREVRGDFVYTAVRLGVPASLLVQGTPAAPAAPRRLAFVFDTSRSALEGKALALELLRDALGELAATDHFVVLASDVVVTPHAADYVAATPEAIAVALDFAGKIDPDGASDLGAALTAVAARKPTEVIYLGDGLPTWGVRDAAALGALAEQLHAPIHAGLIGKGASTELWSELAGRSGGRAALVRSAGDAQRFALAATHAGDAPRLRDARVEWAQAPAAGSNLSLFPAAATTLYAGDELVALMRTPAAAPPPSQLVLTGETARGPIRQTIALAPPVAVAHVAQRWAAYQLAALDGAGASREDLVKVSEEFGLMSRYTSLLVLENDEAYEQHRIARRKAEEQAKLAAAAPQVTGGDLDTLGAREASLSPDEIQPGDPEIKIPAPRDARSVVVSFPFGETKLAVWDVDAAAWMVRFLIDKETPDGAYQVRVTITHLDGRLEVLTLPYTVDTAAPAIQVKVTRVASGYRFRATQLASSDGTRRKDADRVEVVLPDGTVLALPLTRRGLFEGVWRTAPLTSAQTLRVIVRDRALNQATRELSLGGAL
jgi:Vault protein inter-alpha-trypsin domain/von Willebrand factor type A domain